MNLCIKTVASFYNTMTNKDRRIARRQRREENRRTNKAERLAGTSFADVISLDNLYEAGKLAAKNVRWKTRVQDGENNLLPLVNNIRESILAGKDWTYQRKVFKLNERGKIRIIQAVDYRERIVQKSLSINCLKKAFIPTLTSGCSASIEGRGTKYAINLLKHQLRKHYRKHGISGWILKCDFSNYFGSIPQIEVLKMAYRQTEDKDIVNMLAKTFSRELHKDVGLGLGSEVCQILAVSYISRIDHWIEECSGCEATGRYMDDLYVIDSDIKQLKACLDKVKDLSASLGLTLNTKKTCIARLDKPFTFLKKKFLLTSSGKVLCRPIRKSFARQRRKFRRQFWLVKNGIMTDRDYFLNGRSWLKSNKKYDCYNSLKSVEQEFKTLVDNT